MNAKREIEVTFFDAATGKPFATTVIPADQLPDSFEAATTMQLGDENWQVSKAEPGGRAEFEASGVLKLHLNRIEMIDPEKILYSLPSIANRVPDSGETAVDGNEYVIVEDDWRQFELVSAEFGELVDTELAKIAMIHRDHRHESGGWSEIHVREIPETLLNCRIPVADLAGKLDAKDQLSGLCYHGADKQIVSGYSIRPEEGIPVYGVSSSGSAVVIALSQYEDVSPSEASIANFESLAREFDLQLVNWCRCGRVGPDDPLFAALLKNEAV